MQPDKDKKKRRWRRFLNITGAVMLALALTLLVIVRVYSKDFFELRYAEFQDKLYEVQLTIASLSDTWLIVIIIELLFILKSVLPIPLSAIFVISGMVFPYSYAVLINAIGMIFLMSIKYYWGVKWGLSKLDQKLIAYEPVHRLLSAKYGKPVVLLLGRAVPMSPANKISQIYGTLQYPFDRYIVLSLIGFTPKIFSWSIIGRNVFNPFTVDFVAPFIVLLAISGASLLILSAVMNMTSKNEE